VIATSETSSVTPEAVFDLLADVVADAFFVQPLQIEAVGRNDDVRSPRMFSRAHARASVFL
jgi:hypothetical protein